MPCSFTHEFGNCQMLSKYTNQLSAMHKLASKTSGILIKCKTSAIGDNSHFVNKPPMDRETARKQRIILVERDRDSFRNMIPSYMDMLEKESTPHATSQSGRSC